MDKPILTTKNLGVSVPSFKQVLQKTIIYFTFPNPDGWRRGDSDQTKGPGVFFQRYNGNGVDVNRDWPDIGYAFRRYSSLSEPESRGLSAALQDIKADEMLKRIPVVVLTTSKAEEDVLRTYNLHANCYVTKPVDLEKFIVVVRSIDVFWLTVVTLPPNGH